MTENEYDAICKKARYLEALHDEIYKLKADLEKLRDTKNELVINIILASKNGWDVVHLERLLNMDDNEDMRFRLISKIDAEIRDKQLAYDRVRPWNTQDLTELEILKLDFKDASKSKENEK